VPRPVFCNEQDESAFSLEVLKMRWQGAPRSDNVIDARGRGTRMVAGGGIGMAVLALVVYLLGGDPSIVTQTQPSAPREQPGQATDPAEDAKADFVKVVLRDTEDTWEDLFQKRFGRSYQKPQLMLFTGAVESACGFAQAAMGPFYCPRDARVYIDLGFYDQLSERFGAPGEFAQAYVIAHEVGHHIQNVLGISDQVMQARQRASREQANALSVRLELQADCLAGVWGKHVHNVTLEPGDLEAALKAASAIGDDTLQKRNQGYVVPESFTHGSAEQRVTWFRRGFEQGTFEACETFRG
jgi:predicted metalloprotease